MQSVLVQTKTGRLVLCVYTRARACTIPVHNALCIVLLYSHIGVMGCCIVVVLATRRDCPFFSSCHFSLSCFLCVQQTGHQNIPTCLLLPVCATDRSYRVSAARGKSHGAHENHRCRQLLVRGMAAEEAVVHARCRCFNRWIDKNTKTTHAYIPACVRTQSIFRRVRSFELTNDDTTGPSPFGSASRAASIRVNHPFTVDCTAAMVVAGHTRQASDRCSVVRAAMPAPTAIPAEFRRAAPPLPPPSLLLTLLLLSSPSPSGTRGKSRSLRRMGGISRHTLLPCSAAAAASSSSRRRGRGLQPRAVLLRLLLLRRAFPELSKEGRAARGSEERGGCVLSSGRGRNPPVREPPQHCWVLSRGGGLESFPPFRNESGCVCALHQHSSPVEPALDSIYPPPPV